MIKTFFYKNNPLYLSGFQMDEMNVRSGSRLSLMVESRNLKASPFCLKSAGQQTSVCRAADSCLLHGKKCSAVQQIFMSDRLF